MQLQSVIQQHLSQIVADRRYLHQHPELSHQEVNTAAYIAAQLREMGLSPRTGVGGNGVVAVIEGKAPGKCVALRADFDALRLRKPPGCPSLPKTKASAMPAAMICTPPDCSAPRVCSAICAASFRAVSKLVFQPARGGRARFRRGQDDRGPGCWKIPRLTRCSVSISGPIIRWARSPSAMAR